MKNDFKPIIVGIIINISIIIPSIYLYFKSGISSTLDTAVLVFMLLGIINSLDTKNAVVSEIIARGSQTAAKQTGIYFAVIIIFVGNLNVDKTIILTFFLILSSLLGITFFHLTYSGLIDNPEYSFPMIKPRIDLFQYLQESTRDIRLIVAMSITSLYSLLLRILKLIPDTFQLYRFIELGNNPLLVAIGYLIGYKTFLMMGIGFSYSLAVFLIFGTKTFTNHLMHPYIYSIILSIILTQGMLSIVRMFRNVNIKTIYKQFYVPNNLHSHKEATFLKSPIIILAVFIAVNIFYFNSSIPLWSYIVLIPIVLAFSSSTLLGVGKTGFWFSALEEIIPIIVVLLGITRDFTKVVELISILMIFEISGIYHIINLKFSDTFLISRNEAIKYSIISHLSGIITSVFIVYVINIDNTLGSNSMPVPFANTLGLTINGFLDSLKTCTLPEYINVLALVSGIVISVVLNKSKIPPIVVLGGIMLPFGIYIIMGIGSLINFITRNSINNKRIIFSGIATADGLIASIASIQSLLG